MPVGASACPSATWHPALASPQSHISRIENGAVDPRLSNMVKIARALGLDPMLIPGRALPAVLGVLRDPEGQTAGRGPSAIELLVGDGDDE